MSRSCSGCDMGCCDRDEAPVATPVPVTIYTPSADGDTKGAERFKMFFNPEEPAPTITVRELVGGSATK